MFSAHRDPYRSSHASHGRGGLVRGQYSDEEEEEEDRYADDGEEVDSDMDDFIDDSELDDLQRSEFEESLRLVELKMVVFGGFRKWSDMLLT